MVKKILKKILRIIAWVAGSIGVIFGGWFALKILCYFGLIAIYFVNMMLGGGYEERYLYDFKIEAMKDSNTYVVSRYGGDSELQYSFIREMNGRIVSGETYASQSSIVEDGNGRVEVYIEAPEYLTGISNKLSDFASFDSEPMEQKHYIYHIPEGSVETDEYKIDLE